MKANAATPANRYAFGGTPVRLTSSAATPAGVASTARSPTSSFANASAAAASSGPCLPASTCSANERACTESPRSYAANAARRIERPSEEDAAACFSFFDLAIGAGEYPISTPRAYKQFGVGSISRRALLASLGALPALAPFSKAWAFGESSRFIPAVVKHGGKWDLRSSGLRRLAWELQRRTSVEVLLEARPLGLDDPRLFEHPFLYLSSDGDFPPFTQVEVENLRRYLTFGGFLFADANDGSDGAGFDAAIRRELARVLPATPLAPLPSTHVIFKSFFLLDAAPGRFLNKPNLDACVLNKRAAVVYSQNDVLGALNRDESGTFEFEPAPGGSRQRELATRLAVNIAMYALCLDYKDDAVHLPVIMKRRQ